MRDLASHPEPLLAKTGRDSLALLDLHRQQTRLAH